MTKLTYPDLINRLTDLKRLAQPPVQGEQSGCQSSYDRRSRYNPEIDLYEEWDANNDGSGYIREEGDKIVAFEQHGPGTIWRVWSALPDMGHIQIFIDDNPEPVVDMPFRDFFERLGNTVPPMNLPELTPTLSRGRNRFIPIPYNHYCKVLLSPDWGRYYHFTYSTFPEGTTLPQFSGNFDRETWIALAQADRTLAKRGHELPATDESMMEAHIRAVSAGQSVTVCTLTGNRAIIGFSLEIQGLEAPDDREALRSLTLSIYWDGETEPSVWSPVGDFFGCAPGINPYRSLPLGMTPEQFYSHWYMPFAQEAKFVLHNESDVDEEVSFCVVHEPLAKDANTLLRFHAKWHRDTFLEASQQSGRDIDWPLLHVKGRGRFCGIHLHVWNRWQIPDEPPKSWWYGAWQDKTIDWWWGEGDEKFFVDGEKFPSTFGTGSEDYIGYAWAAEPPFPTFESAYACQPYIELDANGHTSVNRFHICDDVPFQSSFEGYIEKYKPNHWRDGSEPGENDCLYAVVAYWYQEPGQMDPYKPLPLEERIEYWNE